MISKLSLLVILLAASGISAAGHMPQPGSFGFNWLDPQSRCRKLTVKDLAPVSKCIISTNAFGLRSKPYACKVNTHVELMVYPTAAECREALETMQANGP